MGAILLSMFYAPLTPMFPTKRFMQAEERRKGLNQSLHYMSRARYFTLACLLSWKTKCAISSLVNMMASMIVLMRWSGH